MNAPLTVHRDGNLARVHMDDGRANALGTRMLQALRQTFAEVKDADAVLLTGRPKVFCGGLDLEEVVPLPQTELLGFLELFHQAMRAVFALQRPLVVAAAGGAIAGGAVLLCAGDLRLGAQDSGLVGVNEVRLGIPFPVSALEMVRSALPAPEAARALIFGELVHKDEALRRGYFHALVPPAELQGEAERRAREVAALPGEATGATKAAVRHEALHRIDQLRETSHRIFSAAWTGPTAQRLLRQVLDGLRSRSSGRGQGA